ncbi:NADPH:quinone oxidoreductase family protein [Nocardioides sp. WL0053]|uniref:NADPH:quinone oxidoreductase family protein n=1 Tax=Nocardioides jiangsuensis TaxID=2866161 RepID=A0ABS7RJN0_9ACTN|nr:NADPH:quinone oxidoreductase family protein [Nocardioides jiangsuensis]MBY9074273.1 NADPH:quinone oxidoreductase family protein [Nocardioides jiangsuensis]
MRAVQVVRLEGPQGVDVVDVPEPAAEGKVLVDVHALGVAFPDLLLSAGQYQLKPEPPFTLGVDFAGVVREAPEGSGFAAGDRVACCLPYGGGADVVAIDPESVFPLPDSMSFEQGAALPMNYLTAQFALATRAQLRAGETVLVHGAAGGVGTASIQVAKGYGARTVAVVSTEEKGEVARRAGADEVVLVDGFAKAVKELTGGRGVDVVVDVVGGDLMTDSLRCLAPLGRLLVVGFTAGAIPEVRVNRLLLNNIDVRGVGWGAYAMVRSGFMRSQWDELLPMMESGVVDPPIGSTYPLEDVRVALTDLAERRATGKSVLSLK